MKARPSRHGGASGLSFLDGEDACVALDDGQAASLLEFSADLDNATVSACPQCRSRVVACVALHDLLTARPEFPRSSELAELSEEAPTLHLYVVDGLVPCRHERWLDPGFAEWSDVVEDVFERP